LSPGTVGGLLPVCLIVDVLVSVAVPVGVLIWVSDFTLLSSAHPVNPIPIAANVKPAIAALMNFRMDFSDPLD
jgi:hypothetical protein